MTLNIADIQNAELKKLAYECDTDNTKGVLSKDEFEIFKSKAQAMEGLEAVDFNQAMGLFRTTPPTKKEEEAAKKAKNERQNDIKNDVKALIDKNKKARLRSDSAVSLNNLVEMLSAKNTNSDYAAIIAEVQTVVDLVKATKFNSKKEVEAIEGKIKKNKDLNDFQKSIISNLVELAKREQINKEAEVIIGIYNEVKADPKNAENYSNYIELVKAEMHKRGLENTSYYSKEAFDAFKQVVEEDAGKVVDQKRQEMVENRSDKASESEVREDLLDSIPETDKVTRDVVKKQKSSNALTGRWLDRDRRAEDLEKISEADLKKELGNDLFNILNRSYLPTCKNSDGTYNVRALSDKLFERVGYDVWMNMSDDTQMSELQGAKNELKVLTGRDLGDKDIKKIMKLVHIKQEPKDRNFMRALKETLVPGLAGAVAGASAYQSLNVTQRVQLRMDATVAEDMISQLKAAGVNPTVTEGADGKLTVTVLQKVLQDNRVLTALAGAGIGVLTGTLMNLIVGMENNEKSCISIADFDLSNERYTNIENYEQYIKDTQPEAKANLVIALAKTYHEKYGDDWAKHYDSDLKKFAGRGSVLNCLEFKGGQLFGVRDLEEDKPADNDSHRYSQHDQAAVDPEYVDVPAIDGSHTSWAQIARQYECLVEKYQLAGAIRILKIAQAIKDGDYSVERLDDLYKKSQKGRSALKNIEGFDYQKYVDALDATYLPKLEKDAEGKPVAGTGVKVPEKLGDCPRNAELSLKVTGSQGRPNKVVAPTGHAADRRQVSQGSAAKYYVRLDGGNIQAFDNMADRDAVVQAFKAKYPNAKVESWSNN